MKLDYQLTLAVAISATVNEFDEIPSGMIYGSLMATGLTLEEYQNIIQLLIRKGEIRQSGNILYARES